LLVLTFTLALAAACSRSINLLPPRALHHCLQHHRSPPLAPIGCFPQSTTIMIGDITTRL